MIDYSVIKEDEYDLIIDSEDSDYALHYSYNLNINYYDDNSTNRGDSDYDTLAFLVYKNSFTPLDYFYQAQQ